MMNRFKDKNILITGAAGGIGRAVAVRLASEGGNLALLERVRKNRSCFRSIQN
jgi:NAD(P)-dependent dehydrogenase (short-subunit alcohol dehydrogenase family)